MHQKVFTVGEIRSLIQESSNEFKARLGAGVKSGNETNNDKAYKDAEKRAKDYDGGLSDSVTVAKYDKTGDNNRTTVDYEVDNVDQNYKDRIEAQAQGYTSVAERENGIEKLGDYDDNKEIFKAIKKNADDWKKEREDDKKAGLRGSKMPEGTFKHDSLYENKNVKTAYFKKTTFLTEGHMMSRIPDEFKVEENVFKMKDKTGNTYLLEWKNGKAEIISHNNKQGMNESIERMKNLFNYNSAEYVENTTASARLNENDERFADTLNKMRKIIK